jgi:CRISPR-associated endoribonuclease Cas6
LPLPWPRNVFHSYLRRWNDFSNQPVDESFLDWVDEFVIIQRHHLASAKVAAGKRGAVTGFTGAIQFSLSGKAQDTPEFVKLFYVLGLLAPYCGTGHKTTFGLGVTRSGWMRSQDVPESEPLQTLLAQRISELTELFVSQRKRQGGQRSQAVAEKQATILARRELGESLQDIATDLDLTYETVKTYAKFARRSLREGGTGRK